jgi:predicted enzyme related to lactoylglutathione lyase
MKPKANSAVYFEVPGRDMKRATRFYKSIFGFDFGYENIHGNEIALLPFNQTSTGIKGTFAKGEIYQPSKSGELVYLAVEDRVRAIDRAIENGGKVLLPRNQASDYGFVAEIEDCEGNRSGLSEVNPWPAVLIATYFRTRNFAALHWPGAIKASPTETPLTPPGSSA